MREEETREYRPNKKPQKLSFLGFLLLRDDFQSG